MNLKNAEKQNIFQNRVPEMLEKDATTLVKNVHLQDFTFYCFLYHNQETSGANPLAIDAAKSQTKPLSGFH